MLRRMLTEVVIPQIVAARAEYIRERGLDRQGVQGDGPDAAGPSAAAAAVMAGLTFDGEALFLNNVVDLVEELGKDTPGLEHIVMMKHPAACSLAQQPLDVSNCFKKAKALLNKLLGKHPDGRQPPYRAEVEQLLRSIKGDSRLVIVRWLSLLPEVLSGAFTMDLVLAGWELSGLSPTDPAAILRMCRAYSKLDDQAAAACVAAMSKLAPRMLENGQLTDEEIQAAVGPTLQLQGRAADDNSGRNVRLAVHQKVLNRRRALLVSHQKIIKDPRVRGRASKQVRAAARV